MRSLSDLEQDLKQLPLEEKWEVAHLLLEDLHEAAHKLSTTGAIQTPDYAERRRRIFGEQILPNIVMEARAEDRW